MSVCSWDCVGSVLVGLHLECACETALGVCWLAKSRGVTSSPILKNPVFIIEMHRTLLPLLLNRATEIYNQCAPFSLSDGY